MAKSTTMNPADQAVNEATAAALAAGQDPFGDDEEIIAPTIADAASAAAADLDEENGVNAVADLDDETEPVVEPTAKAEAAPDPEALAAIAADEPSAVVAQPVVAQPPQFRVASSEAIEADMVALENEKAAAFQKVMDGEMEAKDYMALEARVTRKIGHLQAQATLAEANAQTLALANDNALTALIDSAAKSNQIDYRTDLTAQKQFDIAMSMAEADPANANKAYAALCDEAHAAVLALRGIAKASATTAADVAPVVAGKPDARTPEAAPLTLRGLPNASVPNTGGTLTDALGRLKGAEYQAAFNKLTPAQKAAMVDD